MSSFRGLETRQWVCLLCWSKVSEIWDWVVAAEGQKGNERETEADRQTDRQTETEIFVFGAKGSRLVTEGMKTVRNTYR